MMLGKHELGKEPMVSYRVIKVKGKYYLVKEFWDSTFKKKRIFSIGNCTEIEIAMKLHRQNKKNIKYKRLIRNLSAGVPELGQRGRTEAPLA